MSRKLEGKVAVVTGAGRGIGRSEALALAAEGVKVVVNDVGVAADGTGSSKTPAEEVVEGIKKMGGEAVANYDSVATSEGGENIIKTAIDKFGRLDILVNNAGILRDRMIFNMSEEEWDSVIKVHLYGHFYCTKPACVVFRQQRSGRIINTSSQSALGNMGQANYSAAKEGIIGFTRTVARDMGKYGVTCNAIRPSAATRLTMSPELIAARDKAKAQGLPTIEGTSTDASEARTPEMVASMVVFLCTEEAANINGYDFQVGGGTIGVYTQPVLKESIIEAGRDWTLDELLTLLPAKVTGQLINPAPPQAPTK